MKPLEALKRLKQETAPCTYNPDFDKNKCLDTIETALKDYERRLALAKEYKDVNKVGKRLKALEIIKEKNVDILRIKITQNVEQYNNRKIKGCRVLTQEEYDLLKEILNEKVSI